jgi:glucosamine 6-phosphate synthetase-like amidotransferase/phosphosugar isomerase protein
MCAIYGFLDHGKKSSHKQLTKLLRYLSVSAEVRGTDATGISYVKNKEIVTFKKAKPAHKVKLFFPKGTRTVIGHTRMTTQGSEKYNYNNHPFNGCCGREKFALAHNGVHYNDHELKMMYGLPKTEIETDSYVAVQLLEQYKKLNFDSIKTVSELVQGSFVFTILKNDGTLFLVRGSNPLALYHFPTLGLYVYASTKNILDNALQCLGLQIEFCEIKVSEGEILKISPDGAINRAAFEIAENNNSFWNWSSYDDWFEPCESDELILEYCKMFGVTEDEVEMLFENGYDTDEIEALLMDTAQLEEVLTKIKNTYCVELGGTK